jgi:hypothetical protein
MVIKMNKTTIYIAAVIIIIIVVGIAAYALMNNGNGGSTNPTPTPTATPSTNGVAEASTLTFNANVTTQGSTLEHKWQGKNIHSNAMTLRVDFANYAYILNADEQKSWSSTDSGVTWTQGNFTADWQSFSPQWTDFLNNLEHWSGSGDYSYTNTAGEGVVLFNISVNPSIPDSNFTT